MNDYKELITALSCCQHIASNCADCPLSNSESFEPFTHNCEVKLHNLALTAIEEIVKERDAAIAALCNAVDDHCEICKHDGDEAFCERGCRFEWRGVQEIET